MKYSLLFLNCSSGQHLHPFSDIEIFELSLQSVNVKHKYITFHNYWFDLKYFLIKWFLRLAYHLTIESVDRRLNLCVELIRYHYNQDSLH